MRYVKLILTVPEGTDIEGNLDNAAFGLHPLANVVEYDVSMQNNEIWTFGGDRLEESITS